MGYLGTGMFDYGMLAWSIELAIAASKEHGPDRRYLFRVKRIVQPKTPDCLHILRCQRCQEQADIGDLVRDLMLPEYIAGHDACLLGLGDIRHALGQNRISIVDSAVLGEEADESLP